MSVGDMYHDLVENMGDGTYGDLISRLSHKGFVLKAGQYDDISSQDLSDAWDEYFQTGPEAAVEYLETDFGFVFNQMKVEESLVDVLDVFDLEKAIDGVGKEKIAEEINGLSDTKNYYHITLDNLGEKVELKPRHVESAPTFAIDGEPDVNRICVADSISGCFTSLLGILEIGPNDKVYIYVATGDFKLYDPLEYVMDAEVTGEYWILEPAVFELLGVVQQNDIPKKLRATLANDPDEPQEEFGSDPFASLGNIMGKFEQLKVIRMLENKALKYSRERKILPFKMKSAKKSKKEISTNAWLADKENLLKFETWLSENDLPFSQLVGAQKEELVAALIKKDKKEFSRLAQNIKHRNWTASGKAHQIVRHHAKKKGLDLANLSSEEYYKFSKDVFKSRGKEEMEYEDWLWGEDFVKKICQWAKNNGYNWGDIPREYLDDLYWALFKNDTEKLEKLAKEIKLVL